MGAIWWCDVVWCSVVWHGVVRCGEVLYERSVESQGWGHWGSVAKAGQAQPPGAPAHRPYGRALPGAPEATLGSPTPVSCAGPGRNIQPRCTAFSTAPGTTHRTLLYLPYHNIPYDPTHLPPHTPLIGVGPELAGIGAHLPPTTALSCLGPPLLPNLS